MFPYLSMQKFKNINKIPSTHLAMLHVHQQNAAGRFYSPLHNAAGSQISIQMTPRI
jgi:hypothetical protein